MRLTAMVLSLVCAVSLLAQEDPWRKLETGNDQFQKDSITFGDLIKTRDGLKEKQKPETIVLSCSDSRVPPELVFKQTLGEIFLVRSAGNVTDTDGIASMEYALTRSKPWVTKLLVILAHQKCGAVEAAIEGGESTSPNLTHLLRQIRASFNEPCPKEQDACLALRTKENAEYTVTDLKRRSEIIRKAIDVDKLPVVIGYYELESGKVVVWQRINWPPK